MTLSFANGAHKRRELQYEKDLEEWQTKVDQGKLISTDKVEKMKETAVEELAIDDIIQYLECEYNNSTDNEISEESVLKNLKTRAKLSIRKDNGGIEGININSDTIIQIIELLQ